MKAVTFQDIENMSPEELEAFKREASRAVLRRFAAIFAFKLGVSMVLRRWARKLRLLMKPQPKGQCECGHDLGVHIPDPNRLFAWPCRICSCPAYKEVRT
jgi:hypothetical protein